MRNETLMSTKIRQLGLSLIELMIAMVIGLLLLGGLIQIYLSSKQSYNAQEQLARMQESGRFAMDLITRDLRRAGYWGGNVDLTVITGNPGPAVPAHVCTSGDNSWGRMVNWRVSGVNNGPGDYDCADDHMAGTDVLAVRYANSETIDPVPATGDLFVRSTMFRSRVMTGALAGEAANAIPPDDPTTPQHLRSVVRQLVAHGYYIGDSGQTCPGGQAIPALRRIRLQDGGPVTEIVASGVEQLQVRYLVNDPATNTRIYRDAPFVDALDGDAWRRVEAVRVWLLVRGDCPEQGLENNTTYSMGDLNLVVSDNFRRQLYVSTVMLRNTVVR
jgi:type IV pilus assembly protein PilW